MSSETESTSGPQPSSTDPLAPTPRLRGLKQPSLVVVLFTVLIGALLTAGGFAVGRFTADPARNSYAASACAGLEHWTSEVRFDSEAWIGRLLVDDLSAPVGAATLAMAAAGEDEDRYARLTEAARRARAALVRIEEGDVAAVERGVGAMLDECERLGL